MKMTRVFEVKYVSFMVTCNKHTTKMYLSSSCMLKTVVVEED